jgi:hypothetical protein
LQSSIPFLNATYREHNGAHLPRVQWRAGGGLNRHDAGLALDIILFANVERERILAENIVVMLNDNQPSMNWLSLIYEDVVISGNGVTRHYTQDRKHFTHIHIDWMRYELYLQSGKTRIPWSAEAYTRGFSASLSAELRLLNNDWESGQLSRVNLMNLSRITVGPITVTN